jgi:MFS family permease
VRALPVMLTPVASIMRPITRETITDRRQPALRWSAVFAGATVAVALWVLLQMLGMGAGMAAIDLTDEGSLRGVGIGTTVWTLLAPLIAMFVGGLIAGRLANTFDERIGATHGFVTGALASLVGLVVTAVTVGMLAGSPMQSATRGLALSDDITVHPGMRRADVQRATDRAGKMLLGASLSILVGIGAAIGGGALGAGKLGRGDRKRRARHNTQEVPVVPPPAEPPADALHVTTSKTYVTTS